MNQDLWTVPNGLTFFRILLVPLFVWREVEGDAKSALFFFALASVSDGLDGLFARLLDQRSKLGGLLDPIADKLLIVSAMAALVIQRKLPLWLLGLILFRDGWMVLGAAIVRRKNLEIPRSPSRVGKYATFSLATLIVLSLVDQAVRSPPKLHAYTAVVGFICGLSVLISTLQYFARFGYLLFAQPNRS